MLCYFYAVYRGTVLADELNIEYEAAPVISRFHASDAVVRGLMGPVGSGKSVACCLEIFYRAISQRANEHGVRKSRIAVVRNTFPELKTTTIKTWQDWFPESVCPISWGSPITGRLRIPLPDGTKVDAEILFMPLDKPADVKKLLSLELTMGWINEAREIPKEIVDGMTMRIGRYPAKRDGGPTWVGVFMDTNPPDDDHWWYNMCEVEQPKGWDFFRQPGALIKEGEHWMPNPEAENAHHQPLGYQYWLNMVPGKSLDWINVYVLGNYGTIEDGKPIYPEWNDERHMAKEPLEPYKGIPLRLGFDFGLTPACAFFQVSPKGQIRVLDECVSADMGIRRFVKELVRPMLLNKYDGMPIISHGDPAGSQRAQTAEDTCMQVLAEEGIPTEGAYTQEYIARRESVAGFLTSIDIDGDPGFLMSPTCKVLRKGFNGAYKYERIQMAGEARFRDKPAKTMSSHIHEALQYGVMEVVRGRTQRVSTRREVKHRSASGWT